MLIVIVINKYLLNFCFLIFDRYQALIQGHEYQLQTKEKCASLLQRFDSSKAQWQMGNTKVFLKEILENALEIERGVQLSVLATKIQAHVRGYIAR